MCCVTGILNGRHVLRWKICSTLYRKMYPDDTHVFNDKCNVMEWLKWSELFSSVNLFSVYVFFHGIWLPDQSIYHTLNLTVKLGTGHILQDTTTDRQLYTSVSQSATASHVPIMPDRCCLETASIFHLATWSQLGYVETAELCGASRINWSLTSWGKLWMISTGCAKISVWDCSAKQCRKVLKWHEVRDTNYWQFQHELRVDLYLLDQHDQLNLCTKDNSNDDDTPNANEITIIGVFAKRQILCIFPNGLQASHCDAPPPPHFGWPKIAFGRISHHFRSKRNFDFFLFCSQNGCRRPFWMTKNHFRMYFSPFQINTQLFFDFFSKWPPAAILEVRFGPIWMTENHFRSHFSPFQINTQLFPPAALLEVRFAPKTIGFFHYM